MTPRFLLRMARWARRPRSDRQVMLGLGLVAALLLIAGVEQFVGWPDWLTLDPRGRDGLPR